MACHDIGAQATALPGGRAREHRLVRCNVAGSQRFRAGTTADATRLSLGEGFRALSACLAPWPAIGAPNSQSAILAGPSFPAMLPATKRAASTNVISRLPAPCGHASPDCCGLVNVIGEVAFVADHAFPMQVSPRCGNPERFREMGLQQVPARGAVGITRGRCP